MRACIRYDVRSLVASAPNGENVMLSKKSLVVSSMIATSALAACAAPEASDDAPALDGDDALGAQTEGTTYNGWTQAPYGAYNTFLSAIRFGHVLTRSSGDSTRGGGGCVVMSTGASCSADSTCLTSAQSQYGSTAYGYCYSGSCYSRPGSQADLCVLNPNRSPGTLGYLASGSLYTSAVRVLGCMTKTAGPNTACGGTDTSLYMRTVVGVGIE